MHNLFSFSQTPVLVKHLKFVKSTLQSFDSYTDSASLDFFLDHLLLKHFVFILCALSFIRAFCNMTRFCMSSSVPCVKYPLK